MMHGQQNIKLLKWGTLLLESVTAQIGPAHNIPPMVTLLSHINSVHTTMYCIDIHSTQSSQFSAVQFINVYSRKVIKPYIVVCLIT
jgi:hypothetical protein